LKRLALNINACTINRNVGSYEIKWGKGIMENKTLALIMREIGSIEEAIIEGRGEIDETMEKSLENLENQKANKVDAYKYFIDKFESNAGYYKSKADDLKRVEKALKNASARIKDRIKYLLIDGPENEMIGNDYRFKIANSKPSLVIDESELEDEYLMVVTQKSTR